MNIAPRVVEGRCPHCGHMKITWSPDAIVKAAQDWTEKHGRLPTSDDWEKTAPEHPHSSTASKTFGRWNEMLEAAGLIQRKRAKGGCPRWTKDLIADAMLDFLFREGYWPPSSDWYKSGARKEGRPNTSTVIAVFGSWNAAKRYAGWRPEDELEAMAKTRRLSRERDLAARKQRRADKRALAALPATSRTVASSPGGGTNLQKEAA